MTIKRKTTPCPTTEVSVGIKAGETKLLLDARRLAAMLDCGLRTVRTLDASGRIPAPIRIGGRVLWRTAEILAWLDAGAPNRETWAAMTAAAKKHR